MHAASTPGRGAPAPAAFGRGLARAFAGATIFGLPLFMTMEMWSLGAYVAPSKIALLLVLFFPLLVALSWHAGFECTFRWRDDMVDALVAYAVGFSASAAALWLIGAPRGRDEPALSSSRTNRNPSVTLHPGGRGGRRTPERRTG